MSEYFLRSVFSLSMKIRVIFGKVSAQPPCETPANNIFKLTIIIFKFSKF